jgi:hypothetical protein
MDADPIFAGCFEQADEGAGRQKLKFMLVAYRVSFGVRVNGRNRREAEAQLGAARLPVLPRSGHPAWREGMPELGGQGTFFLQRRMSKRSNGR